jgi:two-component sensor histidine kinase
LGWRFRGNVCPRAAGVQSRAFTEAEQKVAGEIRAGLIEIALRGSHENAVEQGLAGGRQELLIAELNHRVRNVLALIRGLISQTHGEGGDSAKYVESLNGRVQALARAHDRVTRQNWGPGPLYAIFDDEIAAYVPTQRDRFTISGPRVLLAPQAYSAVALIVHELVTNSSKYGALSDSGRVEVTLSVVPSRRIAIQMAGNGRTCRFYPDSPRLWFRDHRAGGTVLTIAFLLQPRRSRAARRSWIADL